MFKIICIAAIAVTVYATHQTCTTDADCTDPCKHPTDTATCHVSHHGGNCHCAHSSTTTTTNTTHGHSHGRRQTHTNTHHLVCDDDTQCSGFCPVNGTASCTTHPHGHNHCTCPHHG